MNTKPCNQTGCKNPGAHRFTWPGRDEDVICDKHVPTLRAVASAMGFSLQIIPITQPEEK